MNELKFAEKISILLMFEIFKWNYDMINSYRACSGGATYFVFEFNYLRFCQIKFVCIDVAMCDPVHDVETVFRLC